MFHRCRVAFGLRQSLARELPAASGALAVLLASLVLTQLSSAQPLLAPPAGAPVTAATSTYPLEVAARPFEQQFPPPVALPPSAELLPTPGDAAASIKMPAAEAGGEVLPPVKIDEAPPRMIWLRAMPWETSIEFGLNGSSGTSDSLSLRAGGHVLRESRFSKLDMDTTYNRTSNGGLDTQDNAQFDVRNDWLLDEGSPWTLFGTGNAFYDKFQAFDLQISANTGIGYRFLHDPALELIGRVGGGTSREFGGPDDRWVPESLFGMEYTQRFTEKQKVTAKFDYYPEWEEVGEYRYVAEAGWEIALDKPSNVCLKLAANDRYDSTPGGVSPHLMNYSVLLLIKL